LSEHPIAADQIRAADLLMLNKQDLVPPERLNLIAERLRQLNPRAPLFATVNGDLHPALVLEPEERPPAPSRTPPGAASPGSHLEEGLWAKSIRLERPLERSAFLNAVEGLSPAV
ncbi:MAG: hypothetical protein MUF46_11285, partial [Desulfobacterales bacterium]|nr:hypothetical protein [Desulfobacterales bacterium]